MRWPAPPAVDRCSYEVPGDRLSPTLPPVARRGNRGLYCTFNTANIHGDEPNVHRGFFGARWSDLAESTDPGGVTTLLRHEVLLFTDSQSSFPYGMAVRRLSPRPAR